MNRTLTLLAVVATALALPAAALAGHGLSYDHAPPSFGAQQEPAKTFTSGGKGAKWELLASFPTANPHTDLDFFTKNGETYGSFGTLGIGANGGGQEILQLTDGGKVAPKRVSFHPSANCVSNPAEALGLQHDVEATPKGNAILNTDVLDAAADRHAAADRRHRRARPLPRPGRARRRGGARRAGSRSST